MSQPETPAETRRRHLLVQATVPPLDEDGRMAFAVGTVLFAVALAWAFLQRDALEAQGRGWWLPTAAAGVVIGALALGYCTWRRRR